VPFNGTSVDFEEPFEDLDGLIVLTVFVELFGLLDDCTLLVCSHTDLALV